MAVEYYIASKQITQQVLDLVGKNHPDLALVSSEIVIVFREKASKAGGQVVLGSSKKAQPLMNALAKSDYKFILEIAQDEWADLTGTQQEALLDHLLCACMVEEDPKSGNTKYIVRKPDVMAFRDNVERYGMWFPKEDDEDDSGPDPVQDMFGDDKDDAPKDDAVVDENIDDLLAST